MAAPQSIDPVHAANRSLPVDQKRRAASSNPPSPPSRAPIHGAQAADYDFLVDHLIDAATLARAVRIGRKWGVAPHQVMLALGWVRASDYHSALTRQGLINGPSVTATRPDDRRTRLRHATFSLARSMPRFSARFGMHTRQFLLLSLMTGAPVGGLLIDPELTIPFWTALLVLPFSCVVALRFLALLHALSDAVRSAWRWPALSIHDRVKADRGPSPPRIPDAALPVYTLLVPLFREARVLRQLIIALKQLDYPAAKLDIKLILEASDTQTIATARALDLPGMFDIVIVPDGLPRTKPKALNYALSLAQGSFVVVFDAEDRPEPGQLRNALAAFASGPPELACVQARLNIYNRRSNWLTRQFTLEYSVLFDALLPSFSRMGLPIPLGGTSNHFRIDRLREAGAWDPFNVTEDADLGVRLHRLGWRVGIIASTTWEEAPLHLSSWIKQRTRWLKGWVQTYIVHTRDLGQLRRDLGIWAFLGFHAFSGGLILSSLVHPMVYGLLIAEFTAYQGFGRPQSLMGASFWYLAIANLILGVTISILLGVVTALRRGFWRIALSAFTMPVYWLLISAAAYRAVWQFARDPFRWEKTEHGQTARRRNHVKTSTAGARAIQSRRRGL